MATYSAVEFSNFKGNFLSSYEQAMEGTWASAIGQLYTGVDAEDVILTAIGGIKPVEQWQGARKRLQPKDFTYTISNKVYETNIPIPVESYKRSGPTLWDPKVQEMGALMADYWNTLGVNVLTSAAVGFDKLALFSASHAGGSNLLTASDVPALNVGTAAAMTADEAAKVLIGLAGYARTLKDDQGNYVNKNAKAFDVVTSNPQNHAALLWAASALQLASGASNPVLSSGYKFTIWFDPSVDTAASVVLYFARTDTTQKGLILIEEQPSQFQEITNENDSYVVTNNEFLFGVKSVRGAGIGSYQSLFKATLS